MQVDHPRTADTSQINLLLGEVVVSIGGMIDLRWVIRGETRCGTACSAQAALTVIGVTTTALFTLAITVHTWYSVYTNTRTKYNLWVWLGFAVAVWLYIILLVIIGYFVHRKGGNSWFVPSPIWCFIDAKYDGARIAGQYLWVWVCGLGGIVLYGQLFLFSRGNLEFQDDNGRTHWKWHLHSRKLPEVSPHPDERPVDQELYDAVEEEKAMRSYAWKMLLYPAAYTLQTLGLSIIRWLPRDQNDSSLIAPGLFFRCVFRLSGLVNVLLILHTRPNVLLFGSRGVLAANDPRRSVQIHNEASGSEEGGSKLEMEAVRLEREI